MAPEPTISGAPASSLVRDIAPCEGSRRGVIVLGVRARSGAYFFEEAEQPPLPGYFFGSRITTGMSRSVRVWYTS